MLAEGGVGFVRMLLFVVTNYWRLVSTYTFVDSTLTILRLSPDNLGNYKTTELESDNVCVCTVPCQISILSIHCKKK